jgi:hypothetical protein
MKLIEAVKLSGNPFIVPDCGRDTLPEFFKDMGFKVGAEIGAYRGEFSAKFCAVGLQMFVIDPWMGFVGQGRTQQVQSTQDGYYEAAKKNLAPYQNCFMIRKTSMDALSDFRDGSLDFVYIDGDHNFRHAAEDIYEWSKKVKRGGVVAGHDYFNTPSFARNVVCNVKSVLDSYVQAFDIKNWYIYKPEKGLDPNDKYYSWLFIKA